MRGPIWLRLLALRELADAVDIAVLESASHSQSKRREEGDSEGLREGGVRECCPRANKCEYENVLWRFPDKQETSETIAEVRESRLRAPE